MAHGITLRMREITRNRKDSTDPRPPRPRDRSLRGKARRRARQAR